MNAKDLNEEAGTEDSGSDVEEFISILERIEAVKKLRRQGISGERSKEGEKKFMGGSKCGWMPRFDWEDFCDRGHKSVSATVKNANGDGGVRIEEQTGRIKEEGHGPTKRPRDDAEIAPKFPSEHRLGKRHLPELKADISDVRSTRFDQNSDDQEESKLALTVGLPGFLRR